MRRTWLALLVAALATGGCSRPEPPGPVAAGGAAPTPAASTPATPKPADDKPSDQKPPDQKPPDEKPADETPAGPKPVAADSPLGRFQAIQAEYDAALVAFSEKLQAAETPEERAKARGQRPTGAEQAAKALKLAADLPKEPVAFDALAWVLKLTPAAVLTPIKLQAADALAARHIDDQNLPELVNELALEPTPASERLVAAVAQATASRELKGTSLFNLSRMKKARSYDAARIDLLTDAERAAEARKVGDDDAQTWTKADSRELAAEADKLLVRVAAEFADVEYATGEKLGQLAENDRQEIKQFAIGAKAPEIEGEDVEGVKFKLSDYRGKVVLLDFWGHW